MSQGWGNQGNQGHHGHHGHGGQQGWGQQGQQQQGWGGQQQGQQQGWGQQGNQGFNQGFNQGQEFNQGQGQGFNQGQGLNQGGIGGGISGLFNQNQDYQIITALDDDLVLDISQGKDASRMQAILWKINKKKNQVFRFREVGGGRYQIISGIGAALHVPSNSSSNGVQLAGGQITNSSAEIFEIFPSQKVKNAFVIKTSNGKAIDVCEGKADKGVPVIQYDSNNGKNQSWIIKPL